MSLQKAEVVVISPFCAAPTNLRIAGGIATHAYEVYSVMEPRLKERIVMVTGRGFDGPIGVKSIMLPWLNIPFLGLLSFHIVATVYLLFALRNFKGKIVHVHCFEMALFPALLAVFKRAKLIVTLHGYVDFAKFPKYLLPLVKITWYVMSVIDCDLVVLSNDSYDYHKQITSRRIHVVPNGFTPDDSISCADRSQKNIIVFTGRLSYEKNVDKLIMAFDELHLEDFYLWIVGDGPKGDKLKKISENVQSSANIKFWGMQTRQRVYELLKQSKIFVLPSAYEGMPISLLEAYSRGVTCICCRNPFTETLPGVLLLENTSVEAIANAISSALNVEPRCDCNLFTQYTWKGSASVLDGVYEECRMAKN